MNEPESHSGAGRPPTRSVIVVGGGLAGLAAGCALADAGYKVRLLERKPFLGGRASSYEHPGTGEVIDNCQHVLLGNCTNLIDFYRRLEVGSRIRWFDRFTFVEPGGRSSAFQPGRLPAPFHSAPSFWAAHAWTAADKRKIARALSEIARSPAPKLQESGESVGNWLLRRRQTPGAMERFWKPLLVSALNEDLDRISLVYAWQVIRFSLLISPAGGRMGVPSVPLGELYGRAADYLEARGGTVHLRVGAKDLSWSDAERAWTVHSDGRDDAADAIVLALPFEAMAGMLPSLPANRESQELAQALAGFEHSPITGIHLWFDRQIADLDHAILLDRTIQWMFHKSRLQPELRSGEGSYVELVVSASRSLVAKSRREIVDLARKELAEFFPLAGEARLVKAAVVKEVRATYSIRPGIDSLRPSAVSPWPGIFLAGDWTATAWPATMEGAVRSGYLAAEAIARAMGHPRRFLAPDLEPSGWMRWFGRGPS